MNHVTSSFLVGAVLLFGAHVSPQDAAPATPKDELAATLKACGTPIDVEDEKTEKAGSSRKVLDYRGVALWFRRDAKSGSEYYLHTAVRTHSPSVLDKGELAEALPCSRHVHYRRLREIE